MKRARHNKKAECKINAPNAKVSGPLQNKCIICKINKTIEDGDITLEFWIIKVHAFN